jgi:hypothetical protein
MSGATLRGTGDPYREPPADEWDALLTLDAIDMVRRGRAPLAIRWVVADTRNTYPWQSAAAWEWLATHDHDVPALQAELAAGVGPFMARADTLADTHTRHPGRYGVHFSQKVHGNKPGGKQFYEKGRGTMADPYVTNDPDAAELARAAGKVVVFIP